MRWDGARWSAHTHKSLHITSEGSEEAAARSRGRGGCSGMEEAAEEPPVGRLTPTKACASPGGGGSETNRAAIKIETARGYQGGDRQGCWCQS